MLPFLEILTKNALKTFASIKNNWLNECQHAHNVYS